MLYIYIYIYIYIIHSCVLVPPLSLSSILKILAFLGVWYPFSTYSKSFGTFDPFPHFQVNSK